MALSAEHPNDASSSSSSSTPKKQQQKHAQDQGQTHELSPRALFTINILSGMGSGTLSAVAVAPLDLIKTRMQVVGSLSHVTETPTIFRTLRSIVQTEGYAACFRGLGPTLCTVPAFWGLYFPTYERCKSAIAVARPGASEDDFVVHVLAAVGAGTVADVVTNPLWVIRTRMQTEALHVEQERVAAQMRGGAPDLKKLRVLGMGQTIRGLYAEGGVAIFWRGLTASLFGLSHVAIQFPLYEWMKGEARRRNNGGRESPLDLLAASGTSKVVASAVTYPHEVIRSRMMDRRGVESKSILRTLRDIVTTEGYGSLYSGLRVSLIRVLPNCCLTFVSYELISRTAKDHFQKTGFRGDRGGGI